MVQYNVIFRDEQPKWQPGCPIYVQTVQVARNTQTSQCFLQLKLQNLTDLKIDKIVLEAIITTPDLETHKIDLKYLDAMLEPNGQCAPQAQELSVREVTDVRVSVKTVGKVSDFARAETIPEPTPLVLSPAAKEARDSEVSLEGYSPNKLPFEAKDYVSWWQCTCGAINVGTSTCRGCRLAKDKALAIGNAKFYETMVAENNKATYEKAKGLIMQGTLASYQAARTELEKIPTYEDVPVLLPQLTEAIHEVQAKLKAIDEANSKKTRKIIIIAVAVLAVVAVAAVAVYLTLGRLSLA